MAEERVVGYDPASTPGGAGGVTNYAYGGRFQAIASATGVTKFFAYGGETGGNVKVAVYADNAGNIGARLGYNDAEQALAANQWNQLSISLMNVVSGNYYWLLAVTGSGNTIMKDDTGGSADIAGATYATWTWPDPSGLGLVGGAFAYNMAYYLLGETGAGGSVIPQAHYYMN